MMKSTHTWGQADRHDHLEGTWFVTKHGRGISFKWRVEMNVRKRNTLLECFKKVNEKCEIPSGKSLSRLHEVMLPKAKRVPAIQELASLARASFSGLSQTVREHVTQPTLMARGRVAHVIAWKGWERPGGGRPATPEAQAYSELSATEQAALFAAGVAEQFAIAEARLRAWSSLDDASDESTDVSRSATPSTELSSSHLTPISDGFPPALCGEPKAGGDR
uniref:protein FAM131A-like n=2 Tax=Myxine glutinosa TaxID=7769 RepID=UPI0035901296